MTDVVTEFRVIRLTDGEERQAPLLEDGSWCCPWCSGPCIPGESFWENRGWEYPCANPAAPGLVEPAGSDVEPGGATPGDEEPAEAPGAPEGAQGAPAEAPSGNEPAAGPAPAEAP